MPRNLKVGDQCEYMIPHGSIRKRCEVRHHARVDGGAPQQLLPVREGRTTRFMCKDHARFYGMDTTRPRQRKRMDDASQEVLL